MDKIQLVKTANQLQQISSESADEYLQKADQLINCMNSTMLARTDLKELIGESNTNMMKDNHANHVRFIAAILKKHNPEVLVDTILWVFRAYRSHGFKTNYWAAQLNTWLSIIKEEITPKSYCEIYPLYEWMQINIPTFVKLSDEKLEASNSLH